MKGRVIHIGPHTLIEGDCLEVIPELPFVDHVLSDPPYEASLHAAKGRASRMIRTDRTRELQPLDFGPIDDIRHAYIAACEGLVGGWFINFCTVEGTAKWADAINPSSMKYKRACIWVKPDSTPQLNGQGPAQGAECFVCAWAGTSYSKWNGGGKRGIYIHACNPSDRHGEHKTEKPVSLMLELVQDFTRRGQLVLDPFMGSGTTGIACVRLGRRFIGIEKDPKYFAIAVERVRAAHDAMVLQPDLFIPHPKPRQQALVLEPSQ